MQGSPGKARLGRIAALAGTATVALVALAAVAFAASPVSGAKYSGHLKLSSADTVTFKVSASGKKVIGVKVMPAIPNRCGSSGGTLPLQVSKPAKIKNGKFSALVEEKLSNGAVSGTATVTGKFLRGGKETGVVENPLPGAEECAGNFPYTAKASKK
jgi:hypothetical protein